MLTIMRHASSHYNVSDSHDTFITTNVDVSAAPSGFFGKKILPSWKNWFVVLVSGHKKPTLYIHLNMNAVICN
jgi:hypothetical protein